MRFIRACRDAAVEDSSFHVLRHTYARDLRMKGADLTQIGVIVTTALPAREEHHSTSVKFLILFGVPDGI
jgi:hypothetical protein